MVGCSIERPRVERDRAVRVTGGVSVDCHRLGLDPAVTGDGECASSDGTSRWGHITADCGGVVIVISDGGCASSDGSSRWATSLPTVAVLSLSSETVGEPTPMKAAAVARSLSTVSVLSLLSETVAADVPVVMEAATGTTSLPTDAVLSEMVSF